MILKSFTYPYDPYGSNPLCRIVGERQTLTPANGPDFNFIVPKAAPFFQRGLKVTHVATNTPLTEGVDFICTHHFDAGSSEYPYLEIFGSITLINTEYSGILDLTYQTLGGEFVLDDQALLDVLANTQLDPRTTTWDQVTYRPTVYNPSDHLQDIEDFVGFTDLVEVARQIPGAISAGNTSAEILFRSHIDDQSNPHGVTAADLQLARFLQIQIASVEEVDTGENGYNIITPLTLAYRIKALMSALNMIGTEGDVPYFDFGGKSASGTGAKIQQRMGIVHTDAEYAAQISYRETPTDIYTRYQRIAYGNYDPVYALNELTGWIIDDTTDRIKNSLNSSSMIGRVSQDESVGDFIFEVETSSSSANEGDIGILVNLWFANGKLRNLVVMRSHKAAGSTCRLILDYGTSTETELLAIDGLGSAANGWATYSQVSKIKIRRQGSFLYLTANIPGQVYEPEESFDMSSNDITATIATAAVHFGLVAKGQPGATWKTLQCTGFRIPVVQIGSPRLAIWTGNGYSEVAGANLKNVLKSGRYYTNPFTKRNYFSPVSGMVDMVTNSAALKEPTTPTATFDRLIAVDSFGKSYGGQEHVLTDGAGTVLGRVKTENGKFGFANAAGEYLAYFDQNGILQHHGVNSLSDIQFKSDVESVPYVDDSAIELKHWLWKESSEIPSALWGTEDMGVIANTVQPIWPHCVSVNPVTGYMSVDYAKLAVCLFLNERAKQKRPWWKKIIANALLLYRWVRKFI